MTPLVNGQKWIMWINLWKTLHNAHKLRVNSQYICVHQDIFESLQHRSDPGTEHGCTCIPETAKRKAIMISASLITMALFVEIAGFEPVTSALRTQRSPS